MKFDNVAIVLTDPATGKGYVRQLTVWETNLVLSQLQALDGGALKLVEIEPVIVRSKGMTEERARHLLEKQQGLHLAAREGVQGLVDMAKVNGVFKPDPVEYHGKTTGVTRYEGAVHNLPTEAFTRTGNALGQTVAQGINSRLPPSLVDHERIQCECVTEFDGKCVDCGGPMPKGSRYAKD